MLARRSFAVDWKRLLSAQQKSANIVAFTDCRWTSHASTSPSASQAVQALDLRNPSAANRKEISKLLHQAVKTKVNTGEFVPRLVIESLCSKYRDSDLDGKKNFLLILARDMHIDVSMAQKNVRFFAENAETYRHHDVKDKGMQWQNEHIERYLRSYRHLRESLTPLYETFFQQILSQQNDGMTFLMKMRADLLSILCNDSRTGPDTAALRSLDASLKSFLGFWFSVGFLNLERVTYERSSGELLEKIILYEAVHPVGTIEELKRRLGRNRRCFAFFHPSVPREPLVFVHVALVKKLACSMKYIREETERLESNHDAKAAIFYSISSTQEGLQGIDLGNFLIKEVAKALRAELPQLEVFSTLSPIPRFIPWLASHTQDKDLTLLTTQETVKMKKMIEQVAPDCNDFSPNAMLMEALGVPNWHENQELVDFLEPILMRLGVRYIYQEKKRSKAICPVANFHIRNGAIFERINWRADLSPKGLSQSAGMMINYKYDLNQVERNNEAYVLRNTIAVGSQPLSLLDSEDVQE